MFGVQYANIFFIHEHFADTRFNIKCKHICVCCIRNVNISSLKTSLMLNAFWIRRRRRRRRRKKKRKKKTIVRVQFKVNKKMLLFERNQKKKTYCAIFLATSMSGTVIKATECVPGMYSSAIVTIVL